MGKCRYCGEDAGFFRGVHAECSRRHDSAVLSVATAASKTIIEGSDPAASDETIRATAKSGWVHEVDLRQLLIGAWEQAVDQALTDRIISAEEETSLVRFADHYQLAQADLDVHGAYSRVVKAAVLRDLTEGKIPTRAKVEETLPFLFQKAESLVWAFPATSLLEYRTSRQYVGRSSGFSVRVAKGVYYHTGGFKGRPVEQVNLVQAGVGMLVITTKNVYFGGTGKNLRMPFSKMVAVEPYSDGVGITREAANPKEQLFVTGDGWFTFNLIKMLSSIE